MSKINLYNPIILLIVSLFCCCENNTNVTVANNEKELIQKALDIHNRVLTLDTHADTPLRMIQPVLIYLNDMIQMRQVPS